MESSASKDPLYSDKYSCKDFVWGKSLGEGKSINHFLNLIYKITGAFGNVIYAWNKKDKKKKVAIKAMKKHDIITSKHVDHIENEKNILELINHPFIVSIQIF
jgi:serine/threonine protein kinase